MNFNSRVQVHLKQESKNELKPYHTVKKNEPLYTFGTEGSGRGKEVAIVERF